MNKFNLANRTNRMMLIGGGILLLLILYLIFFKKPSVETPPLQVTPTEQPVAPSLAAEKPKEYVPGQIMVKFKPDMSSEYILKQQLAQNNATIIDRIPAVNVLILQVPPGTEEQTVQRLINSGVAEYAERDEKFEYNWVPNDPGLSQQYAIKKIQAEAAWDITKGTGIKVGLIDSGLQTSHPDLTGRIAATQNYSGEATLDDKVQHGTHTAGTITASTNNSLGIAGTCPECQLVFVKLGDAATSSNIIKAITWTADNGAKVINMSLGTPGSCSQAMQSAIDYAWGKSAISVVSAGNDSSNRGQSPATCQKVISVAATDANDKKANFSNFGNWVTVTAPGVNVYATFPGSTYKNMSGTSMSAPVTSAVVAMIWSTPYGTSADTVSQRLCNTADKISGTGTNWKCGRVNLLSAVKNTTTSPSSAPSSQPQPSVIVPSFGCMGSPNNVCPTTPPTQSPNPGNPSTGPITSGSPSQSPGNPNNPQPSIQPCDENVAAYNRRGGKRKHVKKQQGSISKFIQWLLQFLIRLIELLTGRGGGNNPITPVPTDPC